MEDPWVIEQLAKSEERRASLTREDYLSILEDLYWKLNPTYAKDLIRGVKAAELPEEWLDTAIVVVQALVRAKS